MIDRETALAMAKHHCVLDCYEGEPDCIQALVNAAYKRGLEDAAKEFDRREVMFDGGPSTGWYEPGEPQKIIRALGADHA